MSAAKQSAAGSAPALRVAQDSSVKSKGWWEWSVWIEGDEADLDRVATVTWHLHPSFPQPVISTSDRASKFRLDSSGWGEFTLRAVVLMGDGGDTLLEHRLRLATPDSSGGGSRRAPSRGLGARSFDAPEVGEAVIPAKQRRVFISHSLADAAVARALRDSLRREDVDVVLADEVTEVGGTETAARSISESDLVVALDSPAAGQYVDLETGYARDQGKPVLRIDLDQPAQKDRPARKVVPGDPNLKLKLSRSLLTSARGTDLAEASRHIALSIDRLLEK